MSRSTDWLTSIAIWFVAGLAFPSLTPATLLLSTRLEPYLVSSAGMANEMAYYVAFTIARIPMTAVLGILVAAAQCAMIAELRPMTRRWIIAAGIGAAASTMIWLPSTLVARQMSGGTLEGSLLTLMLMVGAGLVCGVVSLAQAQAVRRNVSIPGWVVMAGMAAAAAGAFVSPLG